MQNKSSSGVFEFIDDREREFAAILSQLDRDALNRMLDLVGAILLSDEDKAQRSSTAQDEMQI